MNVVSVSDYVNYISSMVKKGLRKHPPIWVLGIIKPKSIDGLTVLKISDVDSNSDETIEVIKQGRWFKSGVYVVKIENGQLTEALKPDGVLELWRDCLTEDSVRLLLKGLQKDKEVSCGPLKDYKKTRR